MNWFRTMNTSKVVDWAIYQTDPRDFGSIHTTWITPIEPHEFPKYNQYKRKISKHACTIVNAVKDLCYNYNIEFKKELVRGAIEHAEQNFWYNRKKGWRTNNAMKAVRSYFKTLWVEAVYIRIHFNDPKFVEYRNAWYMIGCTFRWNAKYVKDYWADWILDWVAFWKSTFWHRSSLTSWSILWKNFVWDSEYWFKYNQYELKHLDQLIKNWVFYTTFYILTLPENMTNTVANIKTDKEKSKELTICENALSIARKHLDEENKQKASELAEYIRSIK